MDPINPIIKDYRSKQSYSLYSKMLQHLHQKIKTLVKKRPK